MRFPRLSDGRVCVGENFVGNLGIDFWLEMQEEVILLQRRLEQAL